MFFHKESKFKMDSDTANATLQNILSACEKAPNTVPFDKLLLRQEANVRPYNIWIIISAVFMLLTFIAPLTIIPLSHHFDELLSPEPVQLIEDYIENDILYLQFTGDDIHYAASYIEYADGSRITPVTIDSKAQIIGFPYEGTEEINIYILLEDGSFVHYLLTPQAK